MYIPIMSAANISRSEAFEDYSLYSNLNDEELLQLAIERSLTDTPCNTSDYTTSKTENTTSPQPSSSSSSLNPEAEARNPSRPSSKYPHANCSSHNATAAKATANYSPPNPPREELPDPKTFDGTVSHFLTGSGKRMVEYRRPDGSLVLLASQPDVEEEPLFKAIRLGDARQVKTLAMHLGTNLMLPREPAWLGIHQAAWYGQDTCLRVLLSAHPGMINERTQRGESALFVAVSRDQLESVQVLLENGVDPNIPNYDKETPLYRACERNVPAMVAALLNHGALVNAPCIWGCTALHEASSQNNVEICEMLLKAGAKHSLTNVYGISPLFTAAQSGRLAALRLLLKHGADINSQAADGATALYEAAKNGHEEIVEFLLSQNANANIPGKTGWLPLHVAAQRGSDM